MYSDGVWSGSIRISEVLLYSQIIGNCKKSIAKATQTTCFSGILILLKIEEGRRLFPPLWGGGTKLLATPSYMSVKVHTKYRLLNVMMNCINTRPVHVHALLP